VPEEEAGEAASAVSEESSMRLTASSEEAMQRSNARRTLSPIMAVCLDRGPETASVRRRCRSRLRGRLWRDSPGAAQQAGHASDQGIGPGEAVGVVAPEPADGPPQDLRPHILCAGEEVVVANLVEAGRHRVPLIRGSRQRLLHELV